MAKAKKSTTSKKMNYGGMTKMKSGGSKFPDLSGDGKVTQKDILMGRGVIKKKHGGVHGGMADRYKNPKSASMMRYGGMKKAQDGTSVPNSLPERIINKSMNPSTNRVQQEEMEAKASVAKTDIRQKGRNKRSEERTDRQAYVQPEKTKRKEIKQTQQTARQISRDQRKVDKAMIKAGMNPKQTKKSGGSVKHGKKK